MRKETDHLRAAKFFKDAEKPYQPPEHQHQFTIPVEWSGYVNIDPTSDYAGESEYGVTKLHCSCGEEVER